MLANERLARERAEYKLQDLLRRLYGAKSEQFDSGQYALLLAEFAADQALAQAQPTPPLTPQTPRAAAPRRGGGRRPAPEHLPIERIELDPPPAERAGLVRIREEITEELDYRPSRFIRRHYVRGVYVDPAHERAPLIAALPERVLPQAAVGPGLLAHVLVAKYTDHQPLARQERIAAREGVELPRQKLMRWVEGAALLLRTVHVRLIERVLGSGYVQVDETPVRVLDPDRGGHAAQAYLWTYLAPRADALVFDFDLSRSRANPTAFFPADWSGVLQSDGYEVYRRLVSERPAVMLAIIGLVQVTGVLFLGLVWHLAGGTQNPV
ncbi:MAG: transposase, partial [Gemmatimonadetes bacterium]|nr:transposase [Gemmatimonadota bacterium]